MNRAPFAAAVALTVSAALGVFLVIAPVALLTLPATPLPAPLPDQHQDAETLLFLLAFAVVLPLAVVLMPRVADGIATGPNAAGAPAIAGALSLALAGGLLFVKVSEKLPWGGGLGVLLVVMALWCVLAAAVLRRAAVAPWAPLGRISGRTGVLWLALAFLVLVLVVVLAFLDSIDLPALIVALAVAAAVLALRGRVRLPSPPRRLGIALDVAIAALVFLAVPNLVVISPEDPSSRFETNIVQFHQDFLLGPASHVVGGGAMLVDTVSQYGVGSIYLIAGWFELTAVTNGMVGLFEGLLAAAVFAGAYLVLRAAGVSRILAATAMLVGLIAFVWGLVYPIGGLLQHGAIRFGLPMAVLLAGVAEARWERRTALARIAGVMVVGVSSIWALEAFAYTLLTAAGLIAALAWLRPAEERWRWVLRRVVAIVGACVVVHLAFAAVTLIATGELPDWGLYLTTLRAFLVGKIGDLTYDFSSWSPGVGVGALYLASAAAIALLMRRAPRFAREHAVALVALAGATAYGVALFSYLVNRSADHIVPYVSLPALMVVVIWLSLLLRSPDVASQRVRDGALAMALAVAALLVAVAWSSAGSRFSDSAIAYVPPGGRSLGDAIDRLEDFPAISPGATRAEAMLDRNMPGENESLVVLTPDAVVEVLARTGRISTLPLSDPWEDSLVPEQHLDSLAETVDGLEPGDRILLDEDAMSTFERFRRDPSLDPLVPQVAQTIVPSGLAVLQVWALDRIGESYRLKVVARGDGPEGPIVAELVPAGSAP